MKYILKTGIIISILIASIAITIRCNAAPKVKGITISKRYNNLKEGESVKIYVELKMSKANAAKKYCKFDVECTTDKGDYYGVDSCPVKVKTSFRKASKNKISMGVITVTGVEGGVCSLKIRPRSNKKLYEEAYSYVYYDINRLNNTDVKVLEDFFEYQEDDALEWMGDITDPNEYIWSKSGRLKKIYWNGGGLRGSINLSPLTDLISFYSEEYEGLQEIDISGAKSLEKLYCSGRLTSLDVSNNINLKEIICSNNLLTELDVSNNNELVNLDCHGNLLTSLVLGNNKKLELIKCDNNQLDTLDTSGTESLISLYCEDNKLISLNVRNSIKLKNLFCDKNQLSTLDVSKNGALEWLDCASNQLTSLDVSKNGALEWLDCASNQLTSLDVSENGMLDSLYCSDNKLTSLNLRNNKKLYSLECENNQLTSLDVSENSMLGELYCSNNNMTNLILHNNKQLFNIECENNHLTSLDVSDLYSLCFLTVDKDVNVIGAEDVEIERYNP